ncbi:nop2/Sun-like domain containing protein 5 [Aphomia sociella]
MFEHSVKVPRHYKVAANIFKKVSTEGGSVKTLLYDDKLRHFRTNVLYALITETIKHAADIDKLFNHCSILENESRLDPWLAKVLTAELLFGKKTLPGKSKPEQTILSYKDQFEKYATDHQDDLKTEVVRRPRYVRINTNLLTTSDAIRAFQDEGYRFIRCTSGSYDDYLKQIQALAEYDFTQDYHVKTVFVFSSGTKLHEHELYLENKIILQDKATALAVHLLAPPTRSVVLDMCAAPGMKTTQLAAYLRNEAKVYAVERNEKRYQTLCDFVAKTSSKCVETLHKDSLEIKRGDMDDVEYILLDPSCSGSGMELCVHNYIDPTRLSKLTSLQEKFLKHAMNSFPKAKRIVYSTCSLFPEENERVVTNVVKTSRAKWRVQDVKELLKGHWNNFGSGMYGSMGTRCLYAKPDSDMTIGFFLAVLDRDEKDLEKSQKSQSIDSQNKTEVEYDETFNEVKKKRKHRDTENGTSAVSEETVIEETVVKKKKKKSKDRKNTDREELVTDDMLSYSENNLQEVSSNVYENPDVYQCKKKKKRKIEDDDNETIPIDHSEEQPSAKKKKKKSKVREQQPTEVCNDPTNENDLPKKKKKK